MNKSLNFEGIENRTEMEYPKETEHAHYTDDTQGDPEGAEQRAAGAYDRLEFPEWIFGNFKLSPNTFWGKRWPDGKEHLVPRERTIEDILAVHESIMTEEKITGALKLGLAMPGFAALKDKYLDLITEATGQIQFGVMRGLQNTTEEALARRAVTRWRYNEAHDRKNTTDEQLQKIFDRAMADSETAGALIMIHREAWRLLQWKNEPNYMRIRNAVIMEQVSSARWMETTYGNKDSVSRATEREYSEAMNF